MTAAGIGVGIVAGKFLLNQPMLAKLPGNTADPKDKWMRYAYLVGISVLGGYALRRVSPSLAKGVALSGLAAVGIDLAASASQKLTSGTAAYLDGPNVQGVGRLLGPRNHSAVQMFSALPQQRQNAFPSSRFAVR
jgi:hypothetical protein